MSERRVLAVPSNGAGGLEGERSAHFGHCDCFTLVEVIDGEVADVRVLQNPPHEQGGCMAPVGILASHGVNELVVAGMGSRPLTGFNDAGIKVYFENQTQGIRDTVKLVLDGAVNEMDARHVCGGH